MTAEHCLEHLSRHLLDAQRAAMTNDSMGVNRLWSEQAAARDCAERRGELATNSDDAIAAAEWRTFSKPSAAMAGKVAAFEKSAGGFKLAPEQLSACRWFGEAMDVALQEDGRREQNTLTKPCAARMPFDWHRWHSQDDNH